MTCGPICKQLIFWSRRSASPIPKLYSLIISGHRTGFLAPCSVTLRVTVDITYPKICTNHCHSTIIKPFHNNHVIVILKIDVISLSFFIIAIFFWSFRIVPRQYIPLSKSFSTNVGELKSCQNKGYWIKKLSK